MAIAIAYAEEAIEDTRRRWACRWIRLAAKRFLKDLERALGPRPPFLFSAKKANQHCAFIELLPHIEGTWDTENIVLEPAQIFFVVQLFGFRAHDGGRRFTEALLAVARKNAKSTLAAAILISCMCLEPENGAQLLTAATTGSQARIVFKIAKTMIEKRPDLCDAYDVEAFANSVLRHESNAVMKPINAKASTQDGLNPSHTGLDEIHAHKTADLFNVLRSAAGARKNPLWLYTTTEGYPNPGPWDDLRRFAQQLLQRVFTADHFLAIIYALDEDDSEFDRSKWIKANPLIETNAVLREEIEKLAVMAQGMPSVHSEFLIKRCNREASTARGWINLHKFMKCGGVLPPDDELKQLPCWGAFDLSSVTDMCSWWLLWRKDDPKVPHPIWYTRGHYWVPEAAVKSRAESRRVPYDRWVREGWITQIPGETIDQDVIQQAIIQDYETFAPTKVAGDPWNAAAMMQKLTEDGLPIEQFIQGPRSYHPAMKAFEAAYISGRLVHDGNPVLKWNAANLVDRRDANMNMAPDKKRGPDKIDGIQCVIMDFGLAEVDDSANFDSYLANPVSV